MPWIKTAIRLSRIIDKVAISLAAVPITSSDFSLHIAPLCVSPRICAGKYNLTSELFAQIILMEI